MRTVLAVRGRGRVCFCAAVFAAVAAARARPACAQRGEDFTLDEELTVAPYPSRGFPGLLDTETAPERGWVANLPSTSLYYGVSPRLTIGTLAAEGPLLVAGPPLFAAHGRYRLASTSWFRTTLDALMIAGDTSFFLGVEGMGRFGLFGSNTEFSLSPRQRILAHVWLGHAGLGSFLSSPATATGLAVGASYAAALREWLSLQVSVLYLASLRAGLDTDSAENEFDFSRAIDPHNRWAFRAVSSLRKGRWLFDVGAFKAGRRLLPWINVAVQLGGAS